jgi:hypothetical protein
MSEQQVGHCGSHGPRRRAYVCRHVAHGSGLGFVTPDEPGDNLHGWCSACERVRRACGGWNDESETHAQIVLICDLCFEAARKRNSY